MLRNNKKLAVRQVIFYAVCLLGVLATILSACASQTVTPTLLSVNTLTQSRPSETSTPNPTKTLLPSPTITATPRPNKYTILSSEFDVPKSCLAAYPTSNETYRISFDQNWIAANCSLYQELVMSNKISGKQLKVRYKEIESGVPENFSLRPLSWSSGNRYLYFTTRCCNSDDRKNSNGSLYRFDLEKESWTLLVRGLYEPLYFFSLDGERYIYLNHHKKEDDYYPEYLEIVMIDASLDKGKKVVLKDYIGPIEETPSYKWSANSDKFGIIIERINFGGDYTWTESKLLMIDFNYWAMELLDKFDGTNLLGDK